SRRFGTSTARPMPAGATTTGATRAADVVTPGRSMSEPTASSLDSLRKLKLVQWGAGYAAAAWITLQVLSLVGQQFDWSPGLLRVITIAFGLGFFVTVVLAWFHGERGEQKVTLGEVGILAVLVALGAGLMWRTLFQASNAAPRASARV